MLKLLLLVSLISSPLCLCQQQEQSENPKLKDPFVSELLAQAAGDQEECPEPEGDGLMFSCEHRSQPVVTVEAGESLTLNCSVSGSRNPSIVWKRNGKTIALGPVRPKRGAGRPFLRTELLHHTVSCVTPRDAGVYLCIAHADGVIIRQKTVVKVSTLKGDAVAKCASSSASSSNVVPAKIYASTETIFDKPGAQARLTCRATGTPTPSISWYKREMDMSFTKVEHKVAGHTIYANGDLLIPPLSLEPVHFAEYKCEAKNEAGEDTALSYIQVMPMAQQEEMAMLAPSTRNEPQSADMLLGDDFVASDIDADNELLLKKRKRNRRQLFWDVIANVNPEQFYADANDALEEDEPQLSSRQLVEILERLEQ